MCPTFQFKSQFKALMIKYPFAYIPLFQRIGDCTVLLQVFLITGIRRCITTSKPDIKSVFAGIFFTSWLNFQKLFQEVWNHFYKSVCLTCNSLLCPFIVMLMRDVDTSTSIGIFIVWSWTKTCFIEEHVFWSVSETRNHCRECNSTGQWISNNLIRFITFWY